ncbi:extracellular solute-binding protein, partial [Dactylosporangium sp. NPDC049140]|uniref:sugar ABC transporter substrate-binding protein n=1 Tax=Dactylosporangium sp. NPDC049140 TaxID=3155647 RepID=UPI003405B4A1
MTVSPRRRLKAAAAVVMSACLAAGCSTSGGTDDAASGSSGSGGTYTIWDPYPQFDDSADWVKLLQKCGTDAGVTVKRTGYDTSDLTNKALLAAQQGNSPDVLIVDNPVVSTLADAGVLTTTAEMKVDTSAVEPNLLAAGQSGGKTYGIPIGANTLALYYNKAVLTAAGVDPAGVKDWASLTAALTKVKAAGKKGITFSAIGTEEGSFQFLPWFWGSGANLTKLDSAEGVSALQ